VPRSPKKSPTKKRSKPKSKKASHPTYRDMITEAIIEDKKWTKGTSRQAIAKFIVSNYGIEESIVRQKLRIALSKAKEDGILIQNKGCYKLSPEWKEDWKKKGEKKTTTSKPKRKSSKKGGKRRKKSTRKRDKDAPKRGQSSYIIFAQSIREDVRKKHPDATFGDISKIIGAKWSKVPDSKRAKFEALAAEDKKRYEREMKAYRKKKKLESSSSSSPSSSSSSSSEAPSSSSSEEGEKKKKRKSDKSSSSSEGEKKKKKSEKSSSSSDEDKKKKEKEKEKEKTDKTEKSKTEEVKKNLKSDASEVRLSLQSK